MGQLNVGKSKLLGLPEKFDGEILFPGVEVSLRTLKAESTQIEFEIKISFILKRNHRSIRLKS